MTGDAAGDRRGIPVVGIVGGIGSGKSEVARALGRVGFVVSDSDEQAREVLRLPEVRRQLAQWWGPGVIGDDGEVDRAAVARIVFRDDDARRRLEELVHPRIHAMRAGVVERAAQEGAAGVVIDAPLLFEAGVDRECGMVVFVDAPWEVRAERVKRSRGWESGELRRREAAQMALDEKRRRSDLVVHNARGLEEVDRAAQRIVQEAERRAGQGGAAGPGGNK